jgi:hypothetical protein
MASDSPSSPAPPRRWLNAAVVGQETSRETWALAAREKLEETAGTYGETVTLKELADWVQERSLIRTKQLSMQWIGDVLGRVARACVERREPLLSSLCVDAKGHVSPAYALSVEVLRHEDVGDPDDHAARERLACHRWFGAELPEDGGQPVVTVRAVAPRPVRASGGRTASPRAATPSRTPSTAARASSRGSAAETAAAASQKPLAICPVHFTELPATGVCDDCD